MSFSPFCLLGKEQYVPKNIFSTKNSDTWIKFCHVCLSQQRLEYQKHVAVPLQKTGIQ